MSLKWIESFVVLCKARLLPQYPRLITGLLSCMSDTDHDGIRADAGTISKAMMQQVKCSSDSSGYVEELLQQLSINLCMDHSSTKLTSPLSCEIHTILFSNNVAQSLIGS